MEGGLIEQTGQAGRKNDEIKLSVMGHEQIIREKGVEKSQSLVNRKQADTPEGKRKLMNAAGGGGGGGGGSQFHGCGLGSAQLGLRSCGEFVPGGARRPT